MSAGVGLTGQEEEEQRQLTVDEIIQARPSDQITPGSVAFSPDDKLISYLVSPESKLGTNIFAFDLTLKEQRLLLKIPEEEVEEMEEEVKEMEEGILPPTKERRRKKLGERVLGFIRCYWAKGASGPTLMVPLPDGIYVQDEQTGDLLLRVPSTDSSPILDPQLSPDGCSIAYVKDSEIYVIPTTTGKEIQITSGARGTRKTNGIADAMTPGETEKRKGLWWSPDSRRIAFLEIEATGVPSSPRRHQGESGGDTDGNSADPPADKANFFIRLGIVSAAGGEVSFLLGGTDHNCEVLPARVTWLLDGYVIAEVLNPAQTKLEILKFNPSTKRCQTLLEKSGTFAYHTDSFTPLYTGGFIWASERSGSRHLYLYDAAGECLGPLTAGNWAVEKILGVDENAGLIYFMATSSPQEVHLFSALIFPDYKFPVESPTQLTRGEGRHIVVLDHQMQRFVDILEGRPEEAPPRVQVCSLANRKLTSTQISYYVSPQLSEEEPIELPTVIPEEAMHDVPVPVSPSTLDPAQLPRRSCDMAESSQEELQRAAAILLKHDAAVFAGLCAGCRPLLHRLLAKLALFDNPEDKVNHTSEEDGLISHSEVEDGTVNHSVAESDTRNVAEDETPSTDDVNRIDRDTASETIVRGCSSPGTVDCTGVVDDAASNRGIHEHGSHQGETAHSSKGKPRLWGEEQSSGSEVDEELGHPLEDLGAGEPEVPQTPAAAAPDPVNTKVLNRAGVGHRSNSDTVRTLTFHSKSDIANFAWANATIASPKRFGEDEDEQSSVTSSTPTESPLDQNWGQVESQRPAVAKRPRLEQEALRMLAVVRKKDFRCIERIRGRLVNVVEGLELHEKVFNKIEMQKLIDMVYKHQEMGRSGLLRERTYSEPRKWMPGKGRVTMQFGCCYNYAQDRNGNPPGIMHEEIVDAMPDLLKTTIRRLVRWGVLPETCIPDSCIVNIYDVGDCIPPHIDHHDFVRPFSTLSLLSECNILFGSKLSIVGEGKFDGPFSVPLPVGSVLVLNGNGADVAKHAVPGVPTKRISITFRKMDPAKVPRGYELPKDLRGIRTAPHLR